MINDYEIDIRFGQWLKSQRLKQGLSLEQVQRHCGLSSERLNSLEKGFAKKGITRLEAENLSIVYNVFIEDVIKHAIH